jgi:hypothetical protein
MPIKQSRTSPYTFLSSINRIHVSKFFYPVLSESLSLANYPTFPEPTTLNGLHPMEPVSIEFLEKASSKIIKIAIPVVITLILDASVVRFIEQTHGTVTLDRSLSETMSYNNSGISDDWAIYIALIFIAAILVVTGVLVALYYFGCLKVIFIWMIIAVSAIFSYYVVVTLWMVPEVLNIPFDYLSLILLLLNLVVVADMSIFWRAPQIVTQFFLVIVSVLIALVFLNLPDWTIWVLLGLLVVYDACVVLCPHGLLNILIRKSEERGDQIPALVYSAAVWVMGVSDDEDLNPQPLLDIHESSQKERKNRKSEEEEEEEDEEERGVRLGLGDFCFYGILVTRAARLGWDFVILCVFAVILGLALTLVVLALLQRPLPALPFSLMLGVLFFITGAMTFRPFGLNIRKDCLAF